ncbi:MAG: glycosyltransferase family 39 protein [Planctomycetaceae bacterium]|nr:glycosyltransferase family 39 protein [Planctomycetaceae bacterium]
MTAEEPDADPCSGSESLPSGSATPVPEARAAGALLLAACLSSIGLMVPMLTAGPLALDEHVTWWMPDGELPAGSLQRSLNYMAVPPLSGWIQQASVALFGHSEWAFRLPSAVWHVLSVLVVFRAGSLMFGQMTGGLAALLMAWHPETLDEVRIARCYGLVQLLSSLLLLMTVQWLRQPRSRGIATGWSLTAAALLWTHYTSALLVLICGGTLLCNGRPSRRRPEIQRVSGYLLFGSLLTVVAAGVPLIPSVLRMKEWGPFLNFMSADVSLTNFFGPLWYVGLPLGIITGGLLQLALPTASGSRTAAYSITEASDGTRSTGTTNKAERQFSTEAWWPAIGCSVLPVLLMFLVTTPEISSLANARYRIAFTPAGACLIAALLRKASPNWSAGAAAVTLTAAWWLSPLPPWQPGRLNAAPDQDWKELALQFHESARPGDAVFVQSGLVESNLVPAFLNDDLFLEYAAARLGRFYAPSLHPRIGLPFLWTGPTDIRTHYRNRLLSIRSTTGVFWVASTTDTDLDRNSLEGIRDIAAEAEFRLEQRFEWKHAVLEEYRITAEQVANSGTITATVSSCRGLCESCIRRHPPMRSSWLR